MEGCLWQLLSHRIFKGRASLLLKQARLLSISTFLFLYSLQDLATFMKEVNAGLTKPVKEGDYDGLVEVMGHLMRVKDRHVATDNMFEPLKQTIELLKLYGEEMPEEIHMQLHVSYLVLSTHNIWVLVGF